MPKRTLQWGHGGDAVEIWAVVSVGSLVTLLQWGHGGDAVEIHAQMRTMPNKFHFNGATAVTPWKYEKTPEFSGVQKHFNGATAVTPWKLVKFNHYCPVKNSC